APYSYPNDDLPYPVIPRQPYYFRGLPSGPPSTAIGFPPPDMQVVPPGAPQAGAPQAGAPQAGAPQAGAPQAFPLSGPAVAPLVEPSFRPVATQGTQAQPRVSSNVATIRVLVPDASAKIVLEGQATKSLGRER